MLSPQSFSVAKGSSITMPFNAGFDITGWAIMFTLKSLPSNSLAMISQAATPVVPLQGSYQVTLSHVQTAPIRAGVYYFDVWRTDVGSENVLAVGTLTITQEVLY